MLKNARERLTQARVNFLLRHPFFGQLAVRLNLIQANEWCPTMAVDGVRMYYNTEFVDAMNDQELMFVVAHEVMHCVYQHFLRRGDRNPRLWNDAGDYVINLELSDLKVGVMPKASSMPNWEKDQDFYAKTGIGPNDPGGLIDNKYRGMTTEEVYDLILEDAENGGKHANALLKNWDVHLDPHQDGQGDGADQDGGEGKSGPVKMTQEELDRLQDELKKAVIDAVNATEELSKSAGSIPGSVKKLVQKWTESRVDWREYILNRVNSTIRNDYTWSRSSRKGRDQGIYLPGMDYDERVDLHIYMDTSGSCVGDIPVFLGEIRGVMEQFSDFCLKVTCFDTRAHTTHEFTPENLDEINSMELEGFGGTIYDCIWEQLEERDEVPSTLLILTDGEPFRSWGNPDYCDTIFLIRGNQSVKAPFGITLHYEDIAE